MIFLVNHYHGVFLSGEKERVNINPSSNLGFCLGENLS